MRPFSIRFATEGPATHAGPFAGATSPRENTSWGATDHLVLAFPYLFGWETSRK